MADELLTPGRGTFKIKRVKTQDKDGVLLETKKGDRKVMLVVEATDSRGATSPVFEHLTKNIAWKIESICKACNRPELYLSSDSCLDRLEDLELHSGECMIDIAPASGEWPAKTIIAKYVTPKAPKPKSPEAEVAAFFDDDQIPF